MRTNFKRFASLFLALVMSLSLLATTAFAYDYSDIPDGCEPFTYGDTLMGYIDADGNAVWFDGMNPWEDDARIDSDTEDPVATDDNTGFTDEDLALVTSFKDVKTTAWYYNDVTECAKLGIVAGFEDGTFRPENHVTDVQWVTMVTRTFYNADIEATQRSKPANTPWYWANTKVATDKYLTNAVTVNDKNMTRYDMAQVVYNVLRAQNKAPSTAERNATQSSIKDYNSVPQNRQIAVKGCYATGLIAGMSDGKFHGAQSMTRAQACTVIMRMLKLINNYNPGDKDNDQYDDGKNQNTGNQTGNNQQTQTGKLANGKDATETNVLSILADLQREWPENTPWDLKMTNGNYYKGAIGSDLKTMNAPFRTPQGATVSLQYACGGFMAMASVRIFGESGAPCREITDASKIRPGDIIAKVDSNNRNIVKHYAVASGNSYKDSGGYWCVPLAEGNCGSVVRWSCEYMVSRPNTDSLTGSYRAFTRYPD